MKCTNYSSKLSDYSQKGKYTKSLVYLFSYCSMIEVLIVFQRTVLSALKEFTSSEKTLSAAAEVGCTKAGTGPFWKLANNVINCLVTPPICK